MTQNSFTYLFRNDVCLCNECFKALEPINRKFEFQGVKAIAIYNYSEKFASMLFQLKGCFDYELTPLFLDRVKYQLRIKYMGYVVVPAPSTEESDEKRGFNHVQEIFKVLKKPIISCIVKTKDIKQSSQGYKRNQIQKYFDIRNGEKLTNRKVLLVDDVKTSGSTLKAMITLVKKYNPRRIEILVLSTISHDISKRKLS